MASLVLEVGAENVTMSGNQSQIVQTVGNASVDWTVWLKDTIFNAIGNAIGLHGSQGLMFLGAGITLLLFFWKWSSVSNWINMALVILQYIILIAAIVSFTKAFGWW